MPGEDDLSNIPKSVLKQQRDADKAIGNLSDPEPTDPPAAEPEPKPADPPAAAPPADPPAAVQPAIDDSQNQSQWEHKYNVLQGKYNKEIVGLRDELSSLKVTADRQNKIIEDLNSKQSDPIVNADNLPGDLNSEDFDGWGPEMKTMVDTINKQNAFIRDQASIIDGLKSGKTAAPDSNMSQRVESIEQEIGKTRGERYTEILDTTIKADWRKLNTDAKFLAWANGMDPITMQPRMNHLRQAASELRGDQVASIFNQYIAIAGDVPANQKTSFVDDIPTGGGHGEGDFNNAGTVTVTEAQLKQAQQDHVQGRITEEEYDKIYKSFQAELRKQRR